VSFLLTEPLLLDLRPPPGHHRPGPAADHPHQPPAFVIVDLTYAQPLSHPASLGYRAPRGNHDRANLICYGTSSSGSFYGSNCRETLRRLHTISTRSPHNLHPAGSLLDQMHAICSRSIGGL
jgi:hypothetical protein